MSDLDQYLDKLGGALSNTHKALIGIVIVILIILSIYGIYYFKKRSTTDISGNKTD